MCKCNDLALLKIFEDCCPKRVFISCKIDKEWKFLNIVKVNKTIYMILQGTISKMVIPLVGRSEM